MRFSTLYDVNADHFWMTPEQTDAAYRQLEDYVFAPLIYNRSRTCCWNSSTTAMYDIIMSFSEQTILDSAAGVCQEPFVFMARDVSDTDDGYAMYRRHAESLGRLADWVTWSADEACEQEYTVTTDAEAQSNRVPWCGLDDVPDSAPCGDTQQEAPGLLEEGIFTDLVVCARERDYWAYEAVEEGQVEITVSPGTGEGALTLAIYNRDGRLLQQSPDDGRYSSLQPSDQRKVNVFVNQGDVVNVEVFALGAGTRSYTLELSTN